MFGDSEIFLKIAAEILEDFSLEEILELNNLSEEDVLAILIENGHVDYPTGYFTGLEGTGSD